MPSIPLVSAVPSAEEPAARLLARESELAAVPRRRSAASAAIDVKVALGLGVLASAVPSAKDPAAWLLTRESELAVVAAASTALGLE